MKENLVFVMLTSLGNSAITIPPFAEIWSPKDGEPLLSPRTVKKSDH